MFRGYSREILNLILSPFQDVSFEGTEVENSLQLDITSSVLRTVCVLPLPYLMFAHFQQPETAHMGAPHLQRPPNVSLHLIENSAQDWPRVSHRPEGVQNGRHGSVLMDSAQDSAHGAGISWN